MTINELVSAMTTTFGGVIFLVNVVGYCLAAVVAFLCYYIIFEGWWPWVSDNPDPHECDCEDTNPLYERIERLESLLYELQGSDLIKTSPIVHGPYWSGRIEEALGETQEG